MVWDTSSFEYSPLWHCLISLVIRAQWVPSDFWSVFIVISLKVFPTPLLFCPLATYVWLPCSATELWVSLQFMIKQWQKSQALFEHMHTCTHTFCPCLFFTRKHGNLHTTSYVPYSLLSMPHKSILHLGGIRLTAGSSHVHMRVAFNQLN